MPALAAPPTQIMTVIEDPGIRLSMIRIFDSVGTSSCTRSRRIRVWQYNLPASFTVVDVFKAAIIYWYKPLVQCSSPCGNQTMPSKSWMSSIRYEKDSHEGTTPSTD